MTGHGVLLLAELIGTLSIVLLALAGTAAALQSGRAPQPAAVPVRRVEDAVGIAVGIAVEDALENTVEAMLFLRYARGDIDAQQYHDLLERATGGVR